MSISKHLNDTLLNYRAKEKLKGHYNVANYIEGLISGVNQTSYFSSVGVQKGDDYEINFKVLGITNSSLTIKYDGTYVKVNISKDEYTDVTLHSDNEYSKTYVLVGLENVKELDLSNNNITHLFIGVDNKLNKLVLNNNSISSLDLKFCKELQFLHMFNNPICDEDKYKSNLIETISSLPDRNDKAMGSLVFYPWYGLETLIEQDDEGNYHKYPYVPGSINNFNHINNPYHKYLYDDNNNFKFYGSRLYGIVKVTEPSNVENEINNDVYDYDGKWDKDILYTGPTGGYCGYELTNLTVGSAYEFMFDMAQDINTDDSYKSEVYFSLVKAKADPQEKNLGTSGKVETIVTFTSAGHWITNNLTFEVEPGYRYFLRNYGNKLFSTPLIKNIVLRKRFKTDKYIEKYCNYDLESKSLVDNDNMNRHHTIRKELEPNLLSKYWVVGSAILYDEKDSQRCTWDFRQLHIADIWETAEKGFGLTLGSVDRFTLLTPEVSRFNILRYISKSQRRYPQYTKEQVKNNESFHGDSCYSLVVGCGVDRENLSIGGEDYIEWLTPTRFGSAPLCDCVFVDRVDVFTELPNMCNENIVDVISTSLSYNGYENATKGSTVSAVHSRIAENEKVREAINKFASKKVLTNSAANGGIARPYLHTFQDMSSEKAHYASVAIWGNDDTSHFMGYYVPSLSKDNTVSSFSVPSQGTTTTPLITDDYIASYGANVPKCSIKNFNGIPMGCLVASSGTSFASPLLASQLLLLINVYKKLPDSDTSSFGKNSEFMRFVKSHWIDRLPHNMDSAQGLGMINPMTEPTREVKLLKNEQSLPSNVYCKLGDYIDLRYADSCKNTFTPEYQFDKIAITRDGHLYPLYNGKIENLPIYSNTSRDTTRLIEDDGSTYYDKNYFKRDLTVNTYNVTVTPQTSTLPLSAVNLNNTEVISLGVNENTDFTVSLCVNLNDTANNFVTSAPTSSTMYIPVVYFKDSKDEINKLQIPAIKNARNTVDFHRAGLTLSSNDKSKNNYNITKYDLAYITTGDSYDYNGDLARNSIKIGDNFGNMVITFVKQGSELLVYYNGTYRGVMSFDNDYIKEFYISKEFLCGDSEDCVYAYNKVFTDDEIAKNTVAILNTHNFYNMYFDIVETSIDGETAKYLCLKPEYRGSVYGSLKSNSVYQLAISDNDVNKVGSCYHKLPQTIVVPSTLNGQSYDKLAPGLFMGNDRLKKVVIESDITTLPISIFNGCCNLETLTGCNNVNHIDSHSLLHTYHLVETDLGVDVPDKKMTVGRQSIQGCAFNFNSNNVTLETSEDKFATREQFINIAAWKDDIIPVTKTNINTINDTFCQGNSKWSDRLLYGFDFSGDTTVHKPLHYNIGCVIHSLVNALFGILKDKDEKLPNIPYSEDNYTHTIEKELKQRFGETVFSDFLNWGESWGGVTLDGYTDKLYKIINSGNNKYYVNPCALLEYFAREKMDDLLTIEQHFTFDGKNDNYSVTDVNNIYQALLDDKYVILTVSSGMDTTGGHAVLAYGIEATDNPSEPNILVVDTGCYHSDSDIAHQPMKYKLPLNYFVATTYSHYMKDTDKDGNPDAWVTYNLKSISDSLEYSTYTIISPKK